MSFFSRMSVSLVDQGGGPAHGNVFAQGKGTAIYGLRKAYRWESLEGGKRRTRPVRRCPHLMRDG
jgi:hypothetical protein